MIYDFYASQYLENQENIDCCVSGKGTFEFIDDWYSRAKLLSLALVKNNTIKKCARVGEAIKGADGKKTGQEYKGFKQLLTLKNPGIRGSSSLSLCNGLIEQELSRMLAIGIGQRPEVNISGYPLNSFFLNIPFELATPYLSHDDDALHICDNPLKKDKVFKIPMVSSSTWKGCLRNAFKGSDYPEQPTKLFGNKRGKEDDLHSGRLFFYSTFFNQIALEVINPHSRKSKSGKNPIMLESVPAGTQGIFNLLYVPFDLMGQPSTAVQQTMLQDLTSITKAIYDMFLKYGFGAKTGAMFGLTKERFAEKKYGRLYIHMSDPENIVHEPQKPSLPEEVRLFLEEHPNEDFSLKAKEWRKKHGVSQQKSEIYKEARSAFHNYQERLKKYSEQLIEYETSLADVPVPTMKRSFNSFDKLVGEVTTLISCCKES